MGGLDPAWIALIGTLCGGIGLKLLEHWLGRSQVKRNDAQQIRDELRTQVAELRDTNRILEKEVDEWRDKYWALREKSNEPRTGV